MKAITISFVDFWNPHKHWVVKRYPCGHYYATQEIDGVRQYSFKKLKVYRVSELIMVTQSELKRRFKNARKLP